MRKRRSTWQGILKPKSDVVGEESADRKTPDVRRYQAGGDDVVERATSGVCGAPSRPVSEAVAADVLKQRQSTTIWGGGDIT